MTVLQGFFSFLLMWSGTILFLQRNQDNKCLCSLSISPSQYIISRIWYWQGITARGIQISLESSWCMAFYQLFIIGGSYSCWASLIVIHVQIFARRKIENWSPSDHILITYGNFLCIFYSNIEQYIAFILNIFNFNSLWEYLNLLYLTALISINHTQVLGNTVVGGGSYIYM